jgi:hypothetical protein
MMNNYLPIDFCFEQKFILVSCWLKTYLIYYSSSQTDAETENIDVLTDTKIKGAKHNNFVIERNWEFIENLKSSRFNFGMSQKPVDHQTPVPAGAEDDDNSKEPPKKRSKHIRFD